MLIDVAKGREIGFFDEGYAFGWADDGEFQLRGRLLGYEALHVPRATCLHRVKAHGTRRAYAQIRNRYRLILTYYSWRTLLLTGPSLLLFEGSLMVMSALKGFLPDWKAAVRDTWRSRHDLLAVRRHLQRRRKRRDSELMEGGEFELPGAVRLHGAMNVLLRLARTVFDFNWWVARRFV
jgi:GT2 family glycosyltransferase